MPSRANPPSHSNHQDGVIEGDFAMVSPKELMTKDIDELRQLVGERREKNADRAAAAAKGGGGGARKRERGGSGSKEERQQQQPQQQREKGKDREGSSAQGNGPAPMDEDGGGGGAITSVELGGKRTLKGHDGEVFTCAFSPVDALVASG